MSRNGPKSTRPAGRAEQDQRLKSGLIELFNSIIGKPPKITTKQLAKEA